MIVHTPADIELTVQYRTLVEDMGPTLAAAVFQRLWLDLAFQARTHGRAGIYEARYTPGFKSRLGTLHTATDKAATNDMILKSLFSSRLIALRDNGDWFVQLFMEYNHHLDAKYVPPSWKWAQDWERFVEASLKAAPAISKKVPKKAWYRPSGTVISEVTMGRALVLIFNMDIIIHRAPRSASVLGTPLIHAACDIVEKHSQMLIWAVMKRFLAMSRPRLSPLAPTTTEDAIHRFDDLVVFTTPDEGFERWVKQVTSNDSEIRDNETGEIAENITKELGHQLECLGH